MSHYIERDKLVRLAETHHDEYINGDPFPFVVIDNFLTADSYRDLSNSFPGPEAAIWYKFRSGKENLKLQSREFHDIPQPLGDLILEFNGVAFVNFLQSLTGIEGLIPDPHLYGGGLHQTLRGGHLGIHVDYNYHETWKLDRRLNAILYFNDDWDDDWGGQLEFWNNEVSEASRKIAPIGNRLVIFSTGEKSWHGHPEPLNCPEAVTRKSIALYFYSNGRPAEERVDSHNTIFRERPGEVYAKTGKEILKDFIPPIISRSVKRLFRGTRS